jgi:hypothetical protein
MAELRRKKGVGEVMSHLYQFGLTPRSGERQSPCDEAYSLPEFGRRGLATPEQEVPAYARAPEAVQGRARNAAIYPPELCHALLFRSHFGSSATPSAQTARLFRLPGPGGSNVHVPFV